jgi:LysM repeat protein
MKQQLTQVTRMAQGVCVGAMAFVLILTTSCRTRDNIAENRQILHPRVLVPAPYREPTIKEDPVVSKWAPSPPPATQVVTVQTAAPPTQPARAVPTPTPTPTPTSTSTPTKQTTQRHGPPKLEPIPAGRVLSPPPRLVNDRRIIAPPPKKLVKHAPRVTSLPPVPTVAPISYRVKKGDTLWDIGRMYGVSMKELAAYNNMNLSDTLPVKKVLRVPEGGKFIPAAQRSTINEAPSKTANHKLDRGTVTPKKTKTAHRRVANASIPADGKYTVKKGDSLWIIGRRFGVSVKDLMGWNGLGDHDLQINDVLLVRPSTLSQPRKSTPTSAPSVYSSPKLTPVMKLDIVRDKPAATLTSAPVPTPELRSMPHFVDNGDTLTVIADMYNSRVEWLLKANPHVKSNDDLKPGMQLKVPFEQ